MENETLSIPHFDTKKNIGFAYNTLICYMLRVVSDRIIFFHLMDYYLQNISIIESFQI